jgi:hypothetical protein
MAGPSSKDAQEQEQNITPAPLASAGERGKSLIRNTTPSQARFGATAAISVMVVKGKTITA